MITQGSRGISGQIAALFITSKLTPLFIVGTLLLGVFAILFTPREEEPQIVVPMADVVLPFPGASARVVEEQLTKPIERKISEIKGVEYVYSISRPGGALIIVRFYVGENMEASLVDLYDKLMSNRDLLPPGSGPFMVKPRDINDVPIVTLTLSSAAYNDYELRQVAEHVLEEVKKVPDTAGGFIVGGRQRELRIQVEPTRLKAFGITPLQIAEVIQGEHFARATGSFQSNNTEYLLDTGRFIQSGEELERLVVGVDGRRPIYLRQVANVIDGPSEATQYVWYGEGPSSSPSGSRKAPRDEDARTLGSQEVPAVTVAVAKQRGTNAVDITRKVTRKVEDLKGIIIPANVQVTVTRDYGMTANAKANTLLLELFGAVVAVVVFMGVVLGPRPAMVASLSIPLTLALTLFTSMLIGYTINRVTLFALIFALGVLVDDAIVVVENILRHLQKSQLSHEDTAIRAVDEVGNPTIMATLTFFAAVLPMAFVSGLMGPYMRPIPINASLAMFYSLVVAFVVVPWFCQSCSRRGVLVVPESSQGGFKEGRIYRFYSRLLGPLLSHWRWRSLFLGGVAFLLLGTFLLFYTRSVVVKMLPFDNKSELQLVIDMPEGTTLEETAKVAKALTRYVAAVPEVRDFQAYVGTASPFNFNGLVRHYFLREGPHQGDIQINLVPKEDRTEQSHDIARRIRPNVQRIGRQYGANVKVVEVPPGPPVQAVLVAEVYGPTQEQQIAFAKDLRKVLETTAGIVDVDDVIEADQVKYVFTVDHAKASLAGISSEEIIMTLRLALEGMKVGLAHIQKEKSPVQIVLRFPLVERTGLEHFGEVALRTRSGGMVPLVELLNQEQVVQETSIYHKNLKSVVYVTGDVGGPGAERAESPVYGILNVGKTVTDMQVSDGRPPQQYYTTQPWSEEQLAIKWDGEWHITYETFRDMGIAFAIALLLIYLLLVGEFQSFLTPIVIMAPIPLTLIGILPGHWLTGSYFTATSMIGFIALAGIVVRNSILLVDFIQQEEVRGVPLRDAIINAGAIRTRPIILTSGTLMVGAFAVILDPIFQGLAVSLLFGAGAATLLTLVVIPLLYFVLFGTREHAKTFP